MVRLLRKVVSGCTLLVATLAAWPLAAQQVVHVGGAVFPPYVAKAEQSQQAGLLPQLLDALNQLQSDFRFVVRPTSIPRRFRDFEQGRIDLSMFENPAWGWQGIAHSAVDMGLEDAEVYVALAKPGRGQDYFNRLRGKRLALFNGYNYGFADFNAEPQFLTKNFNATLSYSHDSNLLMVLHDRADIALVTRSYVRDFHERHGQYAGQLLVSARLDQRYQHQALLRPGAPISPQQLARLFEQLRGNGQLTAIFAPYQIAVSSGVADSSAATGVTD
ncbi:transporter substrate-binding domain-containing protein [Pseudomonas sp.]|jgi:ABC-type amino acid transport substrate-binding protein|uniref:transporter substrate-binding domain-containing protein n=1 Tax=Pseudomonas sp. TaxID=306 RepID=UPI002731A9FF|nr:transporter substrate-binding domain-containing protein [Pseudomonas sp.]MDP2245066.1 amino acid ABC transporter substrate-binding protein [Pseudomonas sp.]